MGAGPAASLKGEVLNIQWGTGDLSILSLLNTFVAGQLLRLDLVQRKSFRITDSLCGVQSILQVSKHPLLPAPSCSLLYLSLTPCSSLCLDGLSLASSGPLITPLSSFLPPSNSLSFCLRPVYTKLIQCQHLAHPITLGST